MEDTAEEVPVKVTTYFEGEKEKGRKYYALDEMDTVPKNPIVRKNKFVCIQNFWEAKYKCILLGCLVFFSVAELFLINIDHIIKDTENRKIIENLIKLIFPANNTLDSE